MVGSLFLKSFQSVSDKAGKTLATGGHLVMPEVLSRGARPEGQKLGSALI